MELDYVVHYFVELVQTLNPSGIPPYNLCLKIRALIMFLRNLISPKFRSSTGVQMLHKNVIKATVFTGCGMGKTVFLSRIVLISSDYNYHFEGNSYSSRQGRFSMTINKAQEQSLKVKRADVKNNYFSHG